MYFSSASYPKLSNWRCRSNRTHVGALLDNSDSQSHLLVTVKGKPFIYVPTTMLYIPYGRNRCNFFTLNCFVPVAYRLIPVESRWSPGLCRLPTVYAESFLFITVESRWYHGLSRFRPGLTGFFTSLPVILIILIEVGMLAGLSLFFPVCHGSATVLSRFVTVHPDLPRFIPVYLGS